MNVNSVGDNDHPDLGDVKPFLTHITKDFVEDDFDSRVNVIHKAIANRAHIHGRNVESGTLVRAVGYRGTGARSFRCGRVLAPSQAMVIELVLM
ncbi:hypothetical protein E4U39_005976 [Claviceps sp. Clav50 group G5]|nr:hypothetical protein E4U39_005976 [Claviceps sp. Clav50 group G5]